MLLDVHTDNRKGYNQHLDSYSGFSDSFEHEETGLNEYLNDCAIRRVFVVGVALDYCVHATACAAAQRGYETYIIQDATRGIDVLAPDKVQKLQELDIKIIDLKDGILNQLKS